MPMLPPDAMAMLDQLSAPVEASRRPEFISAVTSRLETSSPAAIGEGSVARAAREILKAGGYWVAPLDLRQGRVGPRGPRN